MRDDDAQLIRGFLRGDREAVARIEVWIAQAGHPFRHRLKQEWDDLCQDLLLELTRLFRDERFAGESRLRTYVWRVVGNACLDRLRSRHRWAWADMDSAERVLEREGLDRPDMGTRSVERSLLRTVLAKASEECRRMWSMILAGWRYDEMSERLGITSGTLRVRVLRCRRKAAALRDELERADAPTSTDSDVTK